ncbi:MAG: PQQ-dependent sugar dehydrogenase [Patescibacteria group bacterium]
MGKRDWIVTAFIVLVGLGLAGFLQNSLKSGLKPANISTSTLSTGAQAVEPKLTSETLLSGLSNVWDIGFLSDGTALFTERSGTISKIDNNKKVVVYTVNDVVAKGEGGLMGLVVDPDFTTNRFVYACYNTANDIRVSRWKVDATATALTDQINIITGMPVNKTTFPGRHSGCRPRFGADNKLWVGTGDVAIGTNPQDPKSLAGKILRVDRDGKAAEGNLSAPFDARIYSYGHRNVQGLALLNEPKNGVFGYSVEHGSARDDEINPMKSGNFGRDPIPGYNDNAPMTDKTKFPQAIEAVWSSGEPTIAPSGATIITGNKWGTYEGSLVVAVLKAKHLRLFTFDQSGKITAEKELFKEEFGRIRSAVMGPNNDLYLTTDNGNSSDKITRVTVK